MAEIQLYAAMAGTQLSSSMVQPQNPNCLVEPQLFNIMVGPQLLNTMVRTQFLLLASMVDNPIFCLYSPKSTTQLTLFQNLQILRTIVSGHDAISYLGFIMSIVIVLSLRKLYPMLCI